MYYELQGAGPVLMLVGHPMGCSGFSTIAPLLGEDYTVVACDPRGFARSTIENPDQDAEPDLLADDVRRVLEAIGTPAHVFGSSGGAVTALALAVRFPEHVRTIVAHEPPLALMLPDARSAQADIQEVYDTYRNDGTAAAWQRFATFSGLDTVSQAGDSAPLRPSAEMVATSQRFFLHGLLPIALYQPDLPALGRTKANVVVAGGAASKGQFAQRTAVALAERLGTPLADFPGGHTGFASDPGEFASVLRSVLV